VDGAASEVLILRYLRLTISFYPMQYNNTIYHICFIINIAVCAFPRHEFFTEIKLKHDFSVTTLISN